MNHLDSSPLSHSLPQSTFRADMERNSPLLLSFPAAPGLSLHHFVMASCLVFRLPHSASPQPTVDSRQSSSGNLVRAVTPLPSAHRPSAHSLASLSSAPGTLLSLVLLQPFYSPRALLTCYPLLGLCAFPQPEALLPQKSQLPQALLTFHLLWPHNSKHGVPTLCCTPLSTSAGLPFSIHLSKFAVSLLMYCLSLLPNRR